MNDDDKIVLYQILKGIMVVIIIIVVGIAMIRLTIDSQETKTIIRVEYIDDPDSTIYKSEMSVKPSKRMVYVYTIYGLLSINDDNYYYKYNMYEGKKVNCEIEKLIFKDGSFKYKLVEIND